MLPTFVIGLREGLEAALIVGIVAAFLRKQGRRDLLRWVLGGVALAIGLCLAGGIALQAYSQNLPQRQQEGLETVIGALAVAMVTYMVVWMRRNSRNLKGQLEGLAADAMTGRGSAGRAMVLMAFLAVIREGVETVVFLLAAFNESGNTRSAGWGVVLGIAVAVGLGYGIYRGGVRINLSRFFRATGFVLVLVAAGIVVNALHTAHEAGWLNAGQGSTVDLGWLVAPGTVQASVLTGMLGVQSHPVVAEVVGWLLYLVPVGLYVTWPPGRPVPTRLLTRAGAVVAAAGAVAALAFVVSRPSAPADRPRTGAGTVSARVVSADGDTAVLRISGLGTATEVRLTRAGADRVGGAPAERWTAALPAPATPGLPDTLTVAQVAGLNGGRLPFGATRAADGRIRVAYVGRDALTVRLAPHTGRVLDLLRVTTVVAAARTAGGEQALTSPYSVSVRRLPADADAVAVAAARHDAAALASRDGRGTAAIWSGAAAAVGLLVAAGAATAGRRRRESTRVASTPLRAELIRG